MLTLWQGSDLQLPCEGYVAGAGGSVCVCEYMLGQVHAGLGAVLQQVGRSVCAQMQGRDVALLHGIQMCVPVGPSGYLQNGT